MANEDKYKEDKSYYFLIKVVEYLEVNIKTGNQPIQVTDSYVFHAFWFFFTGPEKAI